MKKEEKIDVWYNKEACDKYDWRIRWIWSTKNKLKRIPWNPNTFDWDENSVFLITQPFLFDKKKISLVVPEMTSLYLNISNKHFHAWRVFLNNLEKDNTGYFHIESQWFDYIEEISISIVFAISSLEVFFNQLLINLDKDVEYLSEIGKDWKILRTLKVQDIEWLSLEQKILEVLPNLFGLKEVDISRVTSIFKSLYKLRNDIVHLKAKDLRPHTDITKQSTIWKRIFDQSKNNPALVSIEIIKFFYQKSWKEIPRYIRLLPFKK